MTQIGSYAIGKSTPLESNKSLCGNVAHDSGAVVPEPDGDFSIDDVLSPVPPTPCDTPVLLIRNAQTGNWFAAGIPKN